MRRNVVLSVLCLFIYLLVSCSLVESSEEKGVFALGLNFAMPQNAVAESRGLSRDGEEVNHDEDYQGNEEDWNSIEYTAVVNVIWDGGGSVSTGTLKKVPGQKTAKGDIVVLGVPYEKSLTVNLQIKDSDGDVLYSGTTTTSLKNSTPIEINLSYSEDLDLDLDLKIKYKAILSSDIKLVAKYNNTAVSEEPISLLDKSKGAEITFTCLDSEGNPIPDDEVSSYSWYLNGESISGTTSSISIDPYAQKLLDLGEKNYIECVVTYNEGNKKLACVKGFSFDYTDSFELPFMIYPVGNCQSDDAYSLNQYNPVFKLDENVIDNVQKFAVSPNSNDIYAVTGDYELTLNKIKCTSTDAYVKETEYSLPDINNVYAMTVGYDDKIWIATGNNSREEYFVHAYDDSQTKLNEYYKLAYPAGVAPSSVIALAADKIGTDDYLIVAYKLSGADGSYIQVYKVEENPDAADSNILSPLGTPINVSEICEGCHTLNDMMFVDSEGTSKLCVLLNGSSHDTVSKEIYCCGAVVFGEINTSATSATAENPGISFDLNLEGNADALGLINPESSNAKWSYKSLDDYTAYFPCEAQEDNCFFNATKIVALSGDSVYIADDGAYQQEDDSGIKCGTNKDRIMELNLKTKTISVYVEDLSMSYPSAGIFGSGYDAGE